MKQKAFTPVFTDNLRAKVGENIDKYNNPNYLWQYCVKLTFNRL